MRKKNTIFAVLIATLLALSGVFSTSMIVPVHAEETTSDSEVTYDQSYLDANWNYSEYKGGTNSLHIKGLTRILSFLDLLMVSKSTSIISLYRSPLLPLLLKK